MDIIAIIVWVLLMVIIVLSIFYLFLRRKTKVRNATINKKIKTKPILIFVFYATISFVVIGQIIQAIGMSIFSFPITTIGGFLGGPEVFFSCVLVLIILFVITWIRGEKIFERNKK